MPCHHCQNRQALIDSIRFLQADASFLDWVSNEHPGEYQEVLAMSIVERTIIRAKIAKAVVEGMVCMHSLPFFGMTA